MKITLTKAWKNSRTGERFAAGAELDLADAQAKKLIDAGYAIAIPDPTTETTVTNENASGETNPPIPETEPTLSETNTVETATVSTETVATPPPAEPAPSVPTDDDESRTLRRRREAYEAN